MFGTARRSRELLRRTLEPGEDLTGGIVAYAGPPLWLIYLPVAVAGDIVLVAAILAAFAWGGALAGTVIIVVVLALVVTLVPLGVRLFIPPLYLATTSRRLLCCRLSPLAGFPTRVLFAVPHSQARIVSYRRGPLGSLHCQVPGQRAIRAYSGYRGGRRLAEIRQALLAGGARGRYDDPPYPAPAP